MTEYSQSGYGVPAPAKSRVWTAVIVTAIIYLLVLLYLVLCDFNMDPDNSDGTQAQYMIHLFVCLFIMVGCVFLIFRKKVVGILIVAVGTVASVIYIIASGISFGEASNSGQFAGIIILLTIVPAIILLVLTLAAKK